MTEDHRLIKSAKSARDGNVSEAGIPDDVMDISSHIMNSVGYHTPREFALMVASIILADRLAERERAILAEREACAKIAEDAASHDDDWDTSAWNQAVQYVAVRIRMR